jgi:hypothetical protein
LRGLIRRFIGPVLLLAIIVIGDQIRINRPDHKYRLTLEAETAQGVQRASGVISVHPDRGYGRGGRTEAKGDAIALDLGSGALLAILLAHRTETGKVDLDDINYVAVRAFGKAGQRAVFRQMDRLRGSVPVTDANVPILAAFADRNDPSTMKVIDFGNPGAVLGPSVSIKGLSVEIVPNGWWPLDFGGALGEPVTRDITAKLPWLKQADGAARAAQAAGLALPADAIPNVLFTRD